MRKTGTMRRPKKTKTNADEYLGGRRPPSDNCARQKIARGRKLRAAELRGGGGAPPLAVALAHLQALGLQRGGEDAREEPRRHVDEQVAREEHVDAHL